MVKTFFSASRISELLAEGTGKTAQSYCLSLALESIGCKEELETAAMRHGTTNQINAFDFVLKKQYQSAVWFDAWMPINEKCGSSPDSLVDGRPFDIKCPFHIDNFFEQINYLPKKYYYQVQMQMMSTAAMDGGLCFYLTRPEYFGQEDWEEYPLPLEDRCRIFEFKADNEIQDTILRKVEEYWPKKEALIDLLLSAKHMDIHEYVNIQKNGHSLRELKTASNIFSVENVFMFDGRFYYQKKSK